MDLLEIRGRLDQIDTQIEKLFEERMRLCSEVAEYKIATGKAVYDAEREKQKIESVQAMAEGEFNKQAVAVRKKHKIYKKHQVCDKEYPAHLLMRFCPFPHNSPHKLPEMRKTVHRPRSYGFSLSTGHICPVSNPIFRM